MNAMKTFPTSDEYRKPPPETGCKVLIVLLKIKNYTTKGIYCKSGEIYHL